MSAIMRRTPETEEASSYGYVDFLKDVVQKTVADTTAGFKRPIDFSDEEIMQMAFAGVGGGTKISKGLGKGKFPFSLKTTDVPFWDAVLKKPAYHKKAKGLTARVDFMSPREYFKSIKQNRYERFGSWEEAGGLEELAVAADVKKYAEAMRKGAKFPMPALEYKGGYLGQEGRHRMLAAEKLGIDRVPVLIIRELENVLKRKYKYDAFGQLEKAPVFKSTEEALAFGRSAPKEAADMLKRAMKEFEGKSNRAFEQYRKTGLDEYANEAMKMGTTRQLYREALEVMTGEMK